MTANIQETADLKDGVVVPCDVALPILSARSLSASLRWLTTALRRRSLRTRTCSLEADAQAAAARLSNLATVRLLLSSAPSELEAKDVVYVTGLTFPEARTLLRDRELRTSTTDGRLTVTALDLLEYLQQHRVFNPKPAYKPLVRGDLIPLHDLIAAGARG